MHGRMHPDQFDVDHAQAAALIAASFPELAELPVEPIVSQGTVNAVFRVDDAAARFALQPAIPDEVRLQLEREAERIARFADASPVAAPRPLGLGEPGFGYPLPWSLQTWVDGSVPGPATHASSDALAEGVADLLAGLRAVDVAGEPFRGYGRGDALEPFDAYVRDSIVRSLGLVDTDAVLDVWNELYRLPSPEAYAYSHTDLVPGNLLVDGERLVGVLDSGDASPADPALDLVAAWHLFDRERRALIRDRLDVGDDEWQRGRAWALQQAIGLVWYYDETNPTMAELGRSTLARVGEG